MSLNLKTMHTHSYTKDRHPQIVPSIKSVIYISQQSTTIYSVQAMLTCTKEEAVQMNKFWIFQQLQDAVVLIYERTESCGGPTPRTQRLLELLQAGIGEQRIP